MWLPFYRDLNETLALAPECAAQFCRMLRLVVEDRFDLSVRHNLELGVFGNAGWLIAHDAALNLIQRTAGERRIQLGWTPLYLECRETWAELALSHRERVRQAADHDCREEIEAHLRSILRRKRDAEEESYEFEYHLWCLDVYECFLLGSEKMWSDVDYRSRLRPLMEEYHEFTTLHLFPDIARGLHKEWPRNRDLFLEFEIPWLPDSFWWRHLPSPV